jgi:hypothetical protein
MRSHTVLPPATAFIQKRDDARETISRCGKILPVSSHWSQPCACGGISRFGVRFSQARGRDTFDMCKGIVGLSSELPLLHVVVSAALVIVRCSLAAETNSGGYFIVGLISLANALDE